MDLINVISKYKKVELNISSNNPLVIRGDVEITKTENVKITTGNFTIYLGYKNNAIHFKQFGDVIMSTIYEESESHPLNWKDKSTGMSFAFENYCNSISLLNDNELVIDSSIDVGNGQVNNVKMSFKYY